MLQFSASTVTIPLFRVGVAKVDLAATLESLAKAAKAQQAA